MRRDVIGIEEFYTLLSGEDVELNGFVDLSEMAETAGFQLRARNITALGVQVLGKVLNKTVSTGDDLWGLHWAELSPSRQVYGVGDILFGYICYSVLAGIIMRDLFPETGYSVQSSEDREGWSCFMDTGVDTEGSGRSGAAPGCR